MQDDPHRLPRAVLPRRYEIELDPDLGAATFIGRVRIEADVVEATDRIVLNALDLVIHSASVGDAPAAVELDPALPRLTLRPSAPLAPGPIVIELSFTGILNDKLRGFYRSTYTDREGRSQTIATTQMQSTDCRRAFPCWDEPDFKAVFGITLVVDPDQLALSNGAEVHREVRPDGRHRIRFADTMIMSSYLVAVVVGPLVATPPVDVNGTPVRVVHVPGSERLAQFGLDAAVASLRHFEEYYGIAYPGDKIDLVAVPDFAAGAMENLGLITFREATLLVDPVTSTQAEQERVVDVVAHELAHMWFGDLVTMKWWNGIWLNEAFATFMGVAATDAYRPDWDRWSSFALERSDAFEVDSLASTRPVEFEVRSPNDAEGMFDVLTYEKGGSLLRMLEQYLGEDRFRDGVRHYLAKHAYANTETSDLWDAIERTTTEPVRRLMDSWIWQPGFPLVSATLVGSELVLDQRRFGYSPEVGDDPSRWLVPVHVREIGPNGDIETKVLIDAEPARVTLHHPDSVVVVNAGGHGFFRVSYDAVLRSRLRGHTLALLTTVDRYNLVADAWAAVVAGLLDADEFLVFARGFADEPALAVWQAMATALDGCDRLVDGPARTRFAAMVRALVAPALRRIGWERQPDEDQLTSQLRGLLVRLLVGLGADEDARARCRELFERGVLDPSSVDPELLTAAILTVASTGDAVAFERFLELYRTAPTPQLQVRYLYALADFDDEALVRRACEFALSGEVKSQNAPYLLARAIGNRTQGSAAWQFVRSHWAEANERFPINSIHRMVDPVQRLNRPADGADVQAFFAEHPIPQAAKRLEQILERQRVNVDLRSRQEPVLVAALD